MCLDRVLRAVRTLEDLPHLLAALGHEPLWEEWPAGTLLADHDRIRRAATAGRYAGFAWLALETDAPARTARTIAHRLNRQGRCSGVLAFNADGRQLAMASTFDAGAVLDLDLARPDPVAIASLRRLAHPSGGTLAFAARAADAFAGEAAGRRFFRQFSDTLGRMADSLHSRIPPSDRHALALIQLSRVLFLYFLQSKGWLDGRADFVARAVDDTLSRRRHLQRDLLRPLFFGTLNRPPADRGRAAGALGRIPFLNGGLFEAHALERRWKADFPNLIWRDAFDGLFERFHFTAAETAGGGVISPDMLGRVFEGVMAPGERRASGTFYTPAALVRRMVEAGLTATIASRLQCDDDEAGRRLASGAPEALALLRTITILDPAVGSGAFLLGALERLAQLRRHGAHARVKRAILRRSLFGVDRNAMAIRLTELRLWLAVIADEPDGGASGIAPLPNLDCVVRQGDSLTDPLAGGGVSHAEARRIGQLRHDAVTASGTAKQHLLRELRDSERAAAARAIGEAEERTSREIAGLLAAARAPTLFGDRQRLAPGPRERLRRLRSMLRSLRTGRHRLATDGELPWFHYESQFADVFARGGFDMVIGNPPWVRAESLPPAVRERLAERYRWWRGSGSRGFAHRPDLSVAFLERAYELAAPGGTIALLVPAKIATAGYGAIARSALAARTHLHAVVDLSGDADASFKATAYPMALVATKRQPRPGHRIRNGLDPASADGPAQRELGAGPWIIRGGRAADVARELAGAYPPLSDRFTCRLGVKTGADDVFLDPGNEIEPRLLRWALRGRDLGPFRAVARRRLLWTHDVRGRPVESLPDAAARYVARHDARLRARADYVRGPVWTLFRVAGAIGRHRVVWPDLARGLSAVALAGAAGRGLVPLNTCYVAATASDAESHALAAWLNSSWLRALASLTATPAAGGFRRHAAATVGALPLPPGAVTDHELADLGRRAGAGESVQARLDEVAAAHLRLAPRQRDALAAILRSDDRR